MMRIISRWAFVVSAGVAWLASQRASADVCDDAVATIERSSGPGLECRVLTSLDDTMRKCSASRAPHGDRFDQARFQVSVGLRRCVCANTPDSTALEQQLGKAHTPYAFAQVVASIELARSCSTSDATRPQLQKLEAGIQQARDNRSYCSGPALDINRYAQSKPGGCYEARMRRAAAGYALACAGSDASSDPRIKALEAAETQICGEPVKAPSCEATRADADRLRKSEHEADERQLWGLVATRLIAAAGPRASHDDRECANHMLAAAITDSAVSDRRNQATVDSVAHDPQLRDRLATAVRDALKNDPEAGPLVAQLNSGADLKKVVARAAQLGDEARRRFFSVAGGLGRNLEATRAASAFEQNARGFDIVIAPTPQDCHFADFVNAVLAGIHKAVPANIRTVDASQLTGTVDDLITARTRSCGSTGDAAAAVPGCGAVVAIQVEDRVAGRAGGAAQLRFVTPDGHGGASTKETAAIQIPEFQTGCAGPGAKSSTLPDEMEAAAKLVFDLQFAFATNPREAAVVVDRPVRSDVCGLRALPPVEQRVGPYDGKGLRVEGQELDRRLAGPSDGARDALRAWTSSVGELDGKTASASLRFSSSPYRDAHGNQGEKLEAELRVSNHPAASFATVILAGDAQCHAPLAERYMQAGRMIGNEAGLYFAHQQTQLGPRDAPASPDSPAAPTEPRRVNRKLLAAGVAADLLVVALGLGLLSGDTQTDTSQMLNLTLSSDTRQSVGKGLLVSGALGGVALAIYAATR